MLGLQHLPQILLPTLMIWIDILEGWESYYLKTIAYALSFVAFYLMLVCSSFLFFFFEIERCIVLAMKHFLAMLSLLFLWRYDFTSISTH
jgi:hypothetical protein